jgi:polysaccharide export outer membrane protein
MGTTIPMNHQPNRIKPAPEAGDMANNRSPRNPGSKRAAGPRRVPGLLGAAVLLAAGGAVSCTDVYPVPPVPPEAYVSKPGGSLAPGDEIKVMFSGAPDLNTQQKIQPTGKVSLPTIGEVTAAGKSVTTLQQQLTALYQPHLQDSTVTVSLAAAAAGVYVSGAVLRPGKLPLDRPMTVLEAVMEAGGFTPMASTKQVVVIRNEQGKSRNYVLNLHQAIHGSESTPFYVRPYDVIFVKESFW